MPMLTPKVSIILPFYNAEKTLKRALESIANQSLQDFECIMVDNNSTDEGRKIAQGFAQKNSRFILTAEKKQGVVFASNKGLELAKAEYIARMDADDECTPSRLLLQTKFLDENNDFGAVSGLVEFVPKKENSKGFGEYVDWVNSLTTYEEIYLKRFMEMPIINPTMMWRSLVSEKFGMYRNGDFPEDYELWLRWLDSGVKIGKIQETVLKWYDSDTRLTRTDNVYSNDSFYRAKSPYLAKELAKINKYHPKLAVWGASKTSRKRAKLLQEYGIEICCYIDITNKRQIPDKLMYYKDLPEVGSLFVLVYVKQKLMRTKVEVYLIGKGYEEGRDFLFCS
jgi:glycosyltransferase involved in cell wall biosynthesis